MKHSTNLGILGGSILALALLVGASAGVAHAQTSTSTGQTASSTQTASTTGPVISSVSASSTADGTGVDIAWATDVNSTSQVSYGLTSSYSTSTTPDTDLVTSHSVAITGLTPSTAYHFQLASTGSNGSTTTSGDMTFVTSASSTGGGTSTTTGGTGSTGTSTAVSDLQNQISALQATINALQARLNSLWAELAALTGGTATGGSSGGTGTTASATLTPSTINVPAGNPSIVDFNGRNFGHEETVNITLNGNQIGRAHADGGGNFTTGSMSLPSAAGAYTYTFTGANSGISLSSHVTVQ